MGGVELKGLATGVAFPSKFASKTSERYFAATMTVRAKNDSYAALGAMMCKRVLATVMCLMAVSFSSCTDNRSELEAQRRAEAERLKESIDAAKKEQAEKDRKTAESLRLQGDLRKQLIKFLETAESAARLMVQQQKDSQRLHNENIEKLEALKAKRDRILGQIAKLKEVESESKSRMELARQDPALHASQPNRHPGSGLLTELAGFRPAIKALRDTASETAAAWDRLLQADELLSEIETALEEKQELASVDTSLFTEEEREAHEELLKEIVKKEEEKKAQEAQIAEDEKLLDSAIAAQEAAEASFNKFVTTVSTRGKRDEFSEEVRVAVLRISTQLVAFGQLGARVEEYERSLELSAEERRISDATYRRSKAARDSAYGEVKIASYNHYIEAQRIEAIRATNSVRAMQKLPPIPISYVHLQSLARTLSTARSVYNDAAKVARQDAAAVRSANRRVKSAKDKLTRARDDLEKNSDGMQNEIARACELASELAQKEMEPFEASIRKWEYDRNEAEGRLREAEESLRGTVSAIADLGSQMEDIEQEERSLSAAISSISTDDHIDFERLESAMATTRILLGGIGRRELLLDAKDRLEALSDIGLPIEVMLARNSLVVRIDMTLDSLQE